MDGQAVQTVIHGSSPWQPLRCETVRCLGQKGFSFSANEAVFPQVMPSACQTMKKRFLFRKGDNHFVTDDVFEKVEVKNVIRDSNKQLIVIVRLTRKKHPLQSRCYDETMWLQ
ncbi:hypothetical protein TNCV_5006041 [Trichonephila clavipes]|nr:hypothetical protein TNCV_5006041 [Trichonephila clavipes]